MDYFLKNTSKNFKHNPVVNFRYIHKINKGKNQGKHSIFVYDLDATITTDLPNREIPYEEDSDYFIRLDELDRTDVRPLETYKNTINNHEDIYNTFVEYMNNVLFNSISKTFDLSIQRFDGCLLANKINKKEDYLGGGASGYVMNIRDSLMISPTKNTPYKQDVNTFIPDDIAGAIAVKDFKIKIPANIDTDKDITKFIFNICRYSELNKEYKKLFRSTSAIPDDYRPGDDDFACTFDDQTLLEILLGLIATHNNVYSSPNFLKIYSFSPCFTQINPKNKSKSVIATDYLTGFVYMEHITKPLRAYIENNELSDKDIEYIVFEVMHAFACMQHPNLQLVHYDLHDANVFIYEYKDDDIQKPQGDYLEYIVNGDKFYLDNSEKKYIFKMGDWDWGAKFSNKTSPRILNIFHNRRGPGLENGHPTFYSPAYDIQFFLFSVADALYNRTDSDGYKLRIIPEFIKDCCDWAFQDVKYYVDEPKGRYFNPMIFYSKIMIDGGLVTKSDNVNVDYLQTLKHVNAAEFFQQDFVKNKFKLDTTKHIRINERYAEVDYSRLIRKDDDMDIDIDKNIKYKEEGFLDTLGRTILHPVDSLFGTAKTPIEFVTTKKTLKPKPRNLKDINRSRTPPMVSETTTVAQAKREPYNTRARARAKPYTTTRK